MLTLKGSCHCQAVTFTFETEHPYPFNLCYCSICRKVDGGGGYAINIKGDYETLNVQGLDQCTIYQARIQNPEDEEPWKSDGRRYFCKHCGTMLWVWDPNWPEMFHPFASAIDSELPEPPELTHLMLEFKANWAPVCKGPADKLFDRYPDESIAAWHERLGLEKT